MIGQQMALVENVCGKQVKREKEEIDNLLS